MTLTRWKTLVDIFLTIVFISIAVTGLWPHQFHQHFHLFHIQAGRLFIVLVIIHFGLNWRWVSRNIFGIKTAARAPEA
jgi:hypothetical protein